MKEMVGGCCVCSDERGWPDNPLVYCDGNGCTVAVHQGCYGIVTVPTGPWYCRKCETPENKGKVKCELCPSKSGALKRSDTGGWAHVVCALYIPEVRFGNVTSMEPIVLRLVPSERYNKTCYICQDSGKSHRASAGACMQCNKSGCKQQFHVTCAQSLGLLCEEAGNYLDNVKYCGYCQHHYSKLKKGGNVKTIPPYKPVSHDGQSSDSSGERDGDSSPKGGQTPTHKSKGNGRKSSSHSGSVSGKNTPNSSKTPTNTSQPIDKSRKSPSRRGSSTGEPSGNGSKSNTPAPSPQHSTSEQPKVSAGGSTPGKPSPTAESPSSRSQETVGVISSVASATVVTNTATTPSPAVSSVVQQPPNKPTYQESVITNTEIDPKQTKKRKAISAASAAVDYAPSQPNVSTDNNPPTTISMWETTSHQQLPGDVQMENVDKIVKKAKTETSEDTSNVAQAHYSGSQPPPPPLPPPPPARQSPSSQPSPRHHSMPPMPGPSGLNQGASVRSPSQHQGKGGDREPASLLVSVPLPSNRHGLNLSAHSQMNNVAADCSSVQAQAQHLFHQAQKQAAMEQAMPSHSSHTMLPGRSWPGLNVPYEMQDPNKGMNLAPGPSKEANTSTIRNKKRAAMANSVVSMANTAPATQTSSQMMSNVRRPPQPTPPPIYQETIKDSPPSSPGSEKPLKPKSELKNMNQASLLGNAPHMLGNELNPESGAAARLHEQLSAELAAHAAAGAAMSALIPPPLHNKGSGSNSRNSSSAQSLDQLLERQWEQGSQFLMEQAQHFDIASLLSCLHQLRTENIRLEEHVGGLLQRRDHLLAVNARLAIPLQAQHLTTPGGESSRCPRENGAPMRAPGPVRQESMPAERPHQMMVREVQQKPS